VIARTRLYLDTSILGATVDPGPEDRVAATRRLLGELAADRWEGFISTVVLAEVDAAAESIRRKIADELARAPMIVLEETAESIKLARTYVAAGAILANAENDARHIAIASVHDVRVVVSWNFRHMVNIERKRRINSVNLAEGLPLLDIVSPWEVRSDET
jgi:predicted nucleic acid-binding protein